MKPVYTRARRTGQLCDLGLGLELYLIHIELAHTYMYKNLNNFGQEQDMGTDLYHSTALIEVVKSLSPSNVKRHGKVTSVS